MKKYISLILAMIMSVLVILFPLSVCAEDLFYSQTSTVIYEAQGYYMVYIPMEINVGETVDIVASEINIPENKMLTVSLDCLNMDNAITLTNPNTTDTITVHFSNSNGDITNENRIIGTFDSGSQGMSLSLNSYAESAASVKAGTYTGNIMFSINCVDVY